MKQLNVWITILTLSLIWGSSFIAIKIVLDVIPPLFAFGIRFLVSGCILILASYIPSKKNIEIKNILFWKNSFVLGIFFIVGGQGLLAWGAQYLSSGMTSLLNSTIPLWVVLLLIFVFHTKTTLLTKVGLGFGFGGMMILVGPSIESDEISITGIISLLLSSLFWAIGSIFSDKLSAPQNIFLSAGMFMLIGGILLLILSIILGEISLLPSIYDIDSNFILSYLFLIFVCTVIGYAEFYWLLKKTTAPVANTFAYIVPVVAIFLGWVILDEYITFLTIVATIIILIGVGLIVIKSHK